MDINMYEMLFLLSIVLLVSLIVVGRKQNITYFLMMFVMISVSCFGYATISRADTLDAALIGHRLTYMGGVFIPVLLLFSIMKFCKIDIPKLLVTFCMGFSVMVLFFAFTVGDKSGYYKSVSIIQSNGMTYMVKEYGPLHKLYILLLQTSFLVPNKCIPLR